MNRLWSARVGLLFALLALQVAAAAARAEGAVASRQTATTTAGGTTGTITDTSGGALSGATMTISGTALIGTRTTTSSSEGAYRFQAAARAVNFPITPLRTELANYSGNTTCQRTPKDRYVVFGHASRNYRPIRLDPFGPAGSGLTAATAINESDNSTTERLAWGWIWKGEWNRIISDKALFELRGGESGADRPEKPNGTGLRFEDVVTLRLAGANRDWKQTLGRDQLFGSFSYFTNRPSGRHSFRGGGEVFRQMETETWRKSYPGDVLHVLNNGEASEVYLFQTPSGSANSLWTYSGFVNDSWHFHASSEHRPTTDWASWNETGSVGGVTAGQIASE